ncbi:hypothetical protein B0H16DRAFT_1610719 [Mycena metata]|uniref:Uncharacterized protein n=1 Tax=Mycena metata TaxID=1033252 RepID=A0AAD7MHT4_9AGAR|nr:hypothetical protein B0H16DRAFT_1610719 [Mycena metata]
MKAVHQGKQAGAPTGQGGNVGLNDTDNRMILNGLKVLGGKWTPSGWEVTEVVAERAGRDPGEPVERVVGPQLAPKYLKDWDGNIVGGFGGLGGRGDEGALIHREAGEVDEALMDMPLKDFCTQYQLSKDILDRLRKLGFTTAGALFELEDGQLEEHGFNLGHVLELKKVS